jgi:putative colanic acid biosynthesis glycosyltransferase
LGAKLVKVLQINSVCGIGSTGRIATDINKTLNDQGHDSYIAYGRGLPLNCDQAIRIGKKVDNYTHVALTRVFDLHGFASKKATLEFIKKVELLNPDVIHLHNIHGYYINIKILFDYLKKVNKPVVWTLHDCWAITGHCSHFDYVGCDKWKTGCGECPQKGEYPKSNIRDNSKLNYINKKSIFTGLKNLTIVTPSKWLASLVKESFLKEYPVKVINNGIDLKVFKPTIGDFRLRYGLEGKFIILGVASTWSMRKGLGLFLELSDKLEQDERIVLVGLSEKMNKKLPSNIIGVSRTNDIEELAEIYSSANVFVNPTLEEVMGLTNVEALACGTPVITFNTGGSIECVDRNSGIVVEKGNLNKLRNEIINIKKGIKVFYSRDTINRAKFLFDKNERYQEYLNLYESIN